MSERLGQMAPVLRPARRVGPYTLQGTNAANFDGPQYVATDGDKLVRLQFLANPDPDRVQNPVAESLHPLLQPVLGSGRFAGLDYLVLPAEDNGLPWRIPNDLKPGVWLSRVEMIVDVADAIASLHTRNLLHLRLDARHLRAHGRHVEVLHVGTARELQGRPAVPCLNPAYGISSPAPEQCLFGAGLSRQTDVYQLGVLLAPLCGLSRSREGWIHSDKGYSSQDLPASVVDVCATALRVHDGISLVCAGAFRDALRSALVEARSVGCDSSCRNAGQAAAPSRWLAWAR